jgi:hypothetical protein
VVRRLPALRAEIDRLAAGVRALPADDQYVALVGLTLALPERIDLQKTLLAARERYLQRGTWPSLEP